MRVKVLVLLFCLTTLKLCSQEIVLESGISFSNMKYTALSDFPLIKTTSVNNYIASVKYLHHFSKRFYWEAGIGYEGKGARKTEKEYQSYQSESKYSLHYLDCSFSLIYKLNKLGSQSDLEVGLGSYFSSLLAGKQVGRSVSLQSEAIINSAIIISRNNELNQGLPGVFWPFDLGSVLIARVRKKKFLFSTTYRYGFRNLFASNSSNNGNYHHNAFSISIGYVLLQKK